jgi:hypothetical protein
VTPPVIVAVGRWVYSSPAGTLEPFARAFRGPCLLLLLKTAGKHEINPSARGFGIYNPLPPVQFFYDPVGPYCWKLFGEDQLMWGSDFPHSDSTWAHSLDVIAKNFAGVPDAVRHKITCHNAARLYGIDLGSID